MNLTKEEEERKKEREGGRKGKGQKNLATLYRICLSLRVIILELSWWPSIKTEVDDVFQYSAKYQGPVIVERNSEFQREYCNTILSPAE
ncbi:hypothetical protein TRV_06000 [Trichophyton verrucosum HKI 0517]|uniref:Uncharacterized protein n=1 Tax=Trichophyton verrucosum (strain HKI 0517) TaxID=663202 RepID=D4DFP9_TRIVH|nr:uncharacterized protein TRV_06000 [Trichophyton verrucosum HKI 0517]EFE39330.1 hypothetical protein TRV_06000 [Trichophyton verrucosum HKI 0517]